MSQDERYNGWANRETWAVALHINNDQGWQESVHEAIRARLVEEGDSYSFGDVDDALRARWAGEAVKDDVEDVFDVETYGTMDSPADCQHFVQILLPVIRDIGSLWRVDWAELGASFLSDLDES